MLYSQQIWWDLQSDLNSCNSGETMQVKHHEPIDFMINTMNLHQIAQSTIASISCPSSSRMVDTQSPSWLSEFWTPGKKR